MKNNNRSISYLFKLLVISFVLFSYMLGVVIASDFYKKFEGAIVTPKKTLLIIMELCVRDGAVSEGSYFYNTIKTPIFLSGTVDTKGNVMLTEYIDGEITGIFHGKFLNNKEITGTWMNADSSIQYPFNLKEHYPAGSVQFDIETVSKVIGDCETEHCFEIYISYPAIVNYKNKTVQKKINQVIGIDKDSLGAFIQQEIDWWKEEAELTDAEEYLVQWYESYETNVVFNSKNIVSYEEYIDSYTGGAHGNHVLSLASFDLNTGDRIELSDFLIDDYEQELNTIAEKMFRENNDIGPHEDLEEQGFWFEGGVFSINDNYLLTGNGIYFVFNEYEIAPYAFGMPEFFIPYSKILQLIKQGSIVETLIKK